LECWNAGVMEKSRHVSDF